jgi:hypothetical protein
MVKVANSIEGLFLWIHTFTLKMVPARSAWQMGRSFFERSNISKNEKARIRLFLPIS